MKPYGFQKIYIVFNVTISMKNIDKIDIIELNDAHSKVMQWFFAYPNVPITLTELSKEVAISKKNASLIVNQLLKENFLLREEIGRSWRITGNQKHIYNHTKKIGYNLILIYNLLFEEGIINEIHKIAGNAKSIILFGSYRKGDDNEKSDIDIAVEVAGGKEQKIVKFGEIKKFGYRKNVPINLHIFSRDKIEINLFSNIANGIILEGFLEVRK